MTLDTTATPILPIRFDGKVVLVTGASRGIGRVLATGFAAAGGRVVFVARRQDELARLQGEIEQSGHVGVAHNADLSRPDGVDSMIKLAEARFGGIDVLVNNLDGMK